jgi:dephospho-CoA kinase
MGAATLDGDKLGHLIYAPGTEGFNAVVKTFGQSVVEKDGTINRKALGAIVFSSPAEASGNFGNI